MKAANRSMMTRAKWFASAVMLLLLAACTTSRPQPDGSITYTYSAFDFSGDAWKAQQQQCAPQGMKPADLGTECGFWTCRSRLGCK